MRILLLLAGIFLALSVPAYTCSSDCYQCHPGIPEDTEHEVLKGCTDCHPEHSEELFQSKCGADCFECHSISSVLPSSPAHSILPECIKCHKKLKEKSGEEEIYREFLGG